MKEQQKITRAVDPRAWKTYFSEVHKLTVNFGKDLIIFSELANLLPCSSCLKIFCEVETAKGALRASPRASLGARLGSLGGF